MGFLPQLMKVPDCSAKFFDALGVPGAHLPSASRKGVNQHRYIRYAVGKVITKAFYVIFTNHVVPARAARISTILELDRVRLT